MMEESTPIVLEGARRQMIKPGVYFTAVEGEGIVMDLVADRYYGLTGVSAEIWQGLQANLSIDGIAANITERHFVDRTDAVGVVRDQLEAWVQAALVVEETGLPEHEPRLRPLGMPATETMSLGNTRAFRSLVRCIDLMRAGIWVRWILRRKGLAETLWQLQNVPIENLTSDERDPRVWPLVNTCMWLRWAFTQGRHDCLSRSLTLTAALRRRGVDAEVCLGVRKFPFLAHAWVEVAGMAISEPQDVLRSLNMLARF
jgi:hypothetical protein